MFRKGGQVMDGVMSLAEPRQKYQEAGPVKTLDEMIKDDPYLQEVYGLAKAGYGRDIQQEKSDVLANLLIRGGLAAVSGKGATGSTLRDLASAFQAPTDVALKEMAALKQDPAKMLVAKAAIEQKGAERLQRIKNQQELLDAQKKARILVGPQIEGESDIEYRQRVDKEASKIIRESTYGVGSRFETARKDEKLKEYKDDFNLTGDAAQSYYGFEQNAEKVRKATGQPVRGFMKARPKGAGIEYDGRNKQPGIYYDPYNNNYIQVKGGVATVIPNPLTDVQSMSEIPDVGNKQVVPQKPKRVTRFEKRRQGIDQGPVAEARSGRG